MPREHGIQHRRRITPRIFNAERTVPEGELGLFDVFRDEHLGHGRTRQVHLFEGEFPGTAAAHRPEGVRDKVHGIRFRKTSGHDEHRGGRRIVRGDIVAENAGRKGVQRLGGTRHRRTDGVQREKRPLQVFRGDRAGIVLVHLYLLEHDLSFARELFRRERGVQVHVRENVHRFVQIFTGEMRVETRRVLARPGIEVPASPFHRACDVERRARRRAFEEHVLDEVRDARPFRRFVARTRAHEESDRDAFGFARNEQRAQAADRNEFRVHQTPARFISFRVVRPS